MKHLHALCKILRCCAFLLMAGSLEGYGQENRLDSLVSSFQEYTHTAFQEKLFVHTDKDFYVAGEIIWYKVYCVEASSHKPFDLTKVAYLEIISQTHKPALQAKLSLKQGSGHGSALLPFTLTTGTYKIRAYTSWMQNFSPEYYFEKDITIVNSLASLPPQAGKSKPVYSVQFFPEGGNLVEGIQSKVAFKIVNQFGKGQEGQGIILNQKNDTLATFASLKFGMGHFFLKPVPGETYSALIHTRDGKTIQGTLPLAYDQGYVMTLENTDSDILSISVQSHPGSAPASFVYLMAHTRQVLHAAQVQALREGKAIFRIDKSKLGEGISHFTLFDENRLAVCERLYFKRPLENLVIEAHTSQLQYHTREKVIVDILTSNAAGNPAITNLSLSVFRFDSLQQTVFATLPGYLWLTSDLQGAIEHPDYYFTASNEADLAADHLMLTQGWRRFPWEEILQNKIPSFDFVPELDGHIIPCRITDTRNSLPVKNITAYLSIPGKRIQLYGAVSDPNGKLLFNTTQVHGQNDVVIQTNTERDSLYRITVESPFSSRFSTKAFPEFLLSPQHLGLLADQSVGMQVQHVYAAGKQNQFVQPLIDTTAFYHTPDKSYLLDDFTRFPTTEEVIREYVQEAGIRKKQGKLRFQVVDQSNETFFTEEPLVLLDGLPIFRTATLFAFDPLKIQKLDVIARRYFWGPLVAEGILSFTTYTHNLAGYELDPSALMVAYEGMQRQRVFYSPAYENETQQKSRLPDLRNLLFWSPDNNTDTTGKKNLTFYTSDQTGTYIGVIQGITRKGETASLTFSFKVAHN